MADTNKITLNIEGMTCSNCAAGIKRTLEKGGLDHVDVNFATGEARFKLKENKSLAEIVTSIHNLGFRVIQADGHAHGAHTHSSFSIEKKFYFSLLFTLPLFLHMFLPIGWLHQPLVQLALCIPVFITGLLHFGKSAWGSVKAGVPNMDVLIVIGASAAFVYSLTGTIQFYGTPEVHRYLFYETAATIITLVLLGNLLEHRSVKQTTTAIKELSAVQVTQAKKIISVNGTDHVEEIKAGEIRINDLLVVNTGDKVPADGTVVSGNGTADESMITGESIPVEKTSGDKVIGGTILTSGNIRMNAVGVGEQTVLSQIITLVKNAQAAKPSIQKLGDKISSIFVPIVLGISLFTFIITYFIAETSLQRALMNSIAVLVISCPCAMGLATPTAVMVGIGRAAKRGILIKGGNTLEEFANVKTIVFDKTGTLTTGEFKIKKIGVLNGASEKDVIDVLYNLEQHSSHPIAQAIVKELKHKASSLSFTGISEEKGLGITAHDKAGNAFSIGSYRMAAEYTADKEHQVYVVKNKSLIAFVDLEDTIKSNAAETILALKKQGIKTILLSGDSRKNCEYVAQKLAIDEVHCEKFPSEKLEIIDALVKQNKTAMVGDGINDAPALAKASVGISMSSATQIAIQSAQVVLLRKNDLYQLVEAWQISRHTLITIKQNLFWAFFYNVVAIPVAAVGLLSPMIGALTMAFSDVIVIGNSIRLKAKKILN